MRASCVTPPPLALIELVDQSTASAVPPAVGRLAETLCERYGESVVAVLFYGSCLRSGEVGEGLADLYLLVDDYRSAYASRVTAFFNAMLPPNVYYLEQVLDGQTIRAKYAVVSMRDFRRLTSRRGFHSYFWGRFAQPTAIAHARSAEVSRQVVEALARSVLTFLRRALPRVPAEFSALDLWRTGLGLSYRAELRTENTARSAELVRLNAGSYEALTRAASAALGYDVRAVAKQPHPHYYAQVSASERHLNRIAWWLRVAQGKVLSMLRLVKAVFTFNGGVDYLAWKIERHSGVREEIPERARRYPLVFGWGWLWRLYRRGAFR